MEASSLLSTVVNPAKFEWEYGVTPASRIEVVIAGVIVYLVTIFSLKAMLGGKAVTIPTIFPAIHNVILCLGSAAMFIGCAYEAVMEAQRLDSTTWLFCLPLDAVVKGPLWYWSYIYYLSKYYELLDTVLLVLKARPTSFLHVFHHSVVLLMSYFWLQEAQSLQVMGLMFNTGVHVVMYYYYFLCTLKRPPKWKKWITNIQIIQFVSSFALSLPFWYLHFTGTPCSGYWATVFNGVFNLILLGLFANFHLQNYKAKKAEKAGKAS